MRKILAMAAMALIFTTVLVADSVNIGYLDTDRLMMESEETMEAQRTLRTERQQWEAEIEELDREIDRLYSEYEDKRMILTESGRREAEQEIEQLMQQRQARVQEIFGEGGLYMQKQAELLEPILDRLSGIIETIAIDNNLDVVLDVSAGGILYANPTLDITDQVIDKMKELDIIE
jgi:outer membrane protein